MEYHLLHRERVLQHAAVKVEVGSFKELRTVVCLMCTYFP